ncbi:MAG: arginase [Chloroflexota bacterium]|nr:arginase [Chloroflexota bacterium]
MSDSPRTVRIFGVPMDLGQQRRGVDMGPSALRYAGLADAIRLLTYDVIDCGNIRVPIAEELDSDPSDGKAHNASAVGTVCTDLYTAMRDVMKDSIAIALGGDHTTALGSIAAALEQPGRLGVLWVDAHGDFNTPESTLTGNVHGMVVSALMGHCPPALTVGTVRLQPHQIVMLATRDLDPAERTRLREQGIAVLTMSDIDKMGMKEAVESALRLLTGATSLHVSFDLDSLDPSIAPGVGTPVAGGLTYREAHLLMEMLADDGRVRSLDIVEVNPILDVSNQTAAMAVELTTSLLGKRIL